MMQVNLIRLKRGLTNAYNNKNSLLDISFKHAGL